MFFVATKEKHRYQIEDHILKFSAYVLKMCSVGTQPAHYLHNLHVIDGHRLSLHGIYK